MDLDWPGAGRVPGGAEHHYLYRRILIVFAAAVLTAAAGGCGSAALGHDAKPAPPSPSAATARSVAGAHVTRHHAPGASSLQVLTEPEAGIGPIYRLITQVPDDLHVAGQRRLGLTSGHRKLAQRLSRQVTAEWQLDLVPTP